VRTQAETATHREARSFAVACSGNTVSSFRRPAKLEVFARCASTNGRVVSSHLFACVDMMRGHKRELDQDAYKGTAGCFRDDDGRHDVYFCCDPAVRDAETHKAPFDKFGKSS